MGGGRDDIDTARRTCFGFALLRTMLFFLTITTPETCDNPVQSHLVGTAPWLPELRATFQTLRDITPRPTARLTRTDGAGRVHGNRVAMQMSSQYPMAFGHQIAMMHLDRL